MAIDADGSPRAKSIDPAGQSDTSHHFGNGAPFNAETLPYIVLPLSKDGETFLEDMGLALGDLAVVIYKNTIAPRFLGMKARFPASAKGPFPLI